MPAMFVEFTYTQPIRESKASAYRKSIVAARDICKQMNVAKKNDHDSFENEKLSVQSGCHWSIVYRIIPLIG